jgi:uncharacterized protein (DUF1778 family)
MQPKDQRINFLVTQDERAMLDQLSEWSGLTISDWLRQAIRRAHEAEWERRSAQRVMATEKARHSPEYFKRKAEMAKKRRQS